MIEDIAIALDNLDNAQEALNRARRLEAEARDDFRGSVIQGLFDGNLSHDCVTIRKNLVRNQVAREL